MSKYMMLHVGFEKPTPEIMEAWGKWFESVADRSVEHGGFMGGREITRDGTNELPWGADSITGYSIINAESMDEAVEVASGNPFIASIRIYEVREHG